MRFMPLVLLAFSLAGCASSQEQKMAIDASDNDDCVSYGAVRGSPQYIQCRMMKDQQRQANNAALAAAILSRPQPQPYVLPMPGH